eukprot:4274468-Pleurochrysis_carterae.AAC.1
MAAGARRASTGQPQRAQQRAHAAMAEGAHKAREGHPRRAQQRAHAAVAAGARRRAKGSRSARTSARTQRRRRTR